MCDNFKFQIQSGILLYCEKLSTANIRCLSKCDPSLCERSMMILIDVTMTKDRIASNTICTFVIVSDCWGCMSAKVTLANLLLLLLLVLL